MEMEPVIFAEVPLFTFEQAVCSPEVDPGTFNGVVIAAPERIAVGKGEPLIIPICGYHLVEYIDQQEDPTIQIHIAPAEDMAMPILGIVADEPEDEPEEPDPRFEDEPEPTEEEMKGVLVGGYFNIDAQKYLPMRLTPGEYDVTIRTGKTSSNTVRVRIE